MTIRTLAILSLILALPLAAAAEPGHPNASAGVPAIRQTCRD